MSHPALLPAGFRDVLPAEAERETAALATWAGVFASHGYERVRPPLLEFEEGFARGAGAAVAAQSFRLTDPDSHRTLVLRADHTPQVARIAASRLAGAPRPLRLAYAGDCLRLRGAGDRQTTQAGIELIGADGVAADAEVMLVGVEALQAIGVERLSLDMALPTLAPALLEEGGFAPDAQAALAHALDRKDAAAVAALAGGLGATLTALLQAAGPAGPALAALQAAPLPAACRVMAARLVELVAALAASAPTLPLTIDPLEFRGLAYHTGVAVTVFARGAGEVGRGGRYLAHEGEPATGLTLDVDAALRAAPEVPRRPRVFVPRAAARAAAALRRDGYATIMALADCADPAVEARRLGCALVADGTGVSAVRA